LTKNLSRTNNGIKRSKARVIAYNVIRRHYFKRTDSFVCRQFFPNIPALKQHGDTESC
jgi:hypothetical protein